VTATDEKTVTFEGRRTHLRAVAYRLLGSVHGADDTVAPAERLAFCLHDLLGMPVDEIAPMLGRSTAACRQRASRAGAGCAAGRDS